MKKEIWIPKTKTKVQTNPDGHIVVWDEITMELKPISGKLGFSNNKEENDSQS